MLWRSIWGNIVKGQLSVLALWLRVCWEVVQLRIRYKRTEGASDFCPPGVRKGPTRLHTPSWPLGGDDILCNRARPFAPPEFTQNRNHKPSLIFPKCGNSKSFALNCSREPPRVWNQDRRLTVLRLQRVLQDREGVYYRAVVAFGFADLEDLLFTHDDEALQGREVARVVQGVVCSGLWSIHAVFRSQKSFGEPVWPTNSYP